MDILKRHVAPITDEAWEEIDQTAKEAIIPMLSARRILQVIGPKGTKYSGIQDGRLEVFSLAKDEVKAGKRIIEPLIETRIPFEISKWELDNINRGCKNPDLSILESAAKKIALFEEDIIYNGNAKAKIKGFISAAENKMKIGTDGNSILKNIADAKYKLFENSTEGPFDLILSSEVYENINTINDGASLAKVVKNLIGGEIYKSKLVKGALLIPHKVEDFEFILGRDFAVGYEGDNDENVRLFLTESFTFRILDTAKYVYFS